MKYYVPEHQQGYQQIADRGISSWDELHGSGGFEDAAIRPLLLRALPHCVWQGSTPHALEYGCGTGPGACLLAEQGFQVTGVDLDPLAITLAQREAAKRGLDIRYKVGDVCAWQGGIDGRYDLIVDSFCLQSIVTDRDRAALMRFVKGHLRPTGYYLICTAGFSAARRYGEAHFDPQSGMVYVRVDAGAHVEDISEIGGALYMPYRRHLRLDQLSSEVASFGFIMKWQHVDAHGNLALLCAV